MSGVFFNPRPASGKSCITHSANYLTPYINNGLSIRPPALVKNVTVIQSLSELSHVKCCESTKWPCEGHGVVCFSYPLLSLSLFCLSSVHRPSIIPPWFLFLWVCFKRYGCLPFADFNHSPFSNPDSSTSRSPQCYLIFTRCQSKSLF
jgi:hypothetical protein